MKTHLHGYHVEYSIKEFMIKTPNTQKKEVYIAHSVQLFQDIEANLEC